jgi:hypothetical protein
MNKIGKIIKTNLLVISGVAAGAIAGYLYWKLRGCPTGTCPITSTWGGSTLYGALLGALIFSLFKKEKNRKVNKDEEPK